MIGTQITESSALRFPPTSHICGFYETEEEHRALVTPFLLQGLERGERVVYITDTYSARTILEYLQDGGVDTESALARGQLLLRTAQDTYCLLYTSPSP
ncbi:MAG: MEDS domain-containing protein, partial [Anaerolineae bacterium]|nr:MEDS domain-containing protein [Anaerolineae bacterium]